MSITGEASVRVEEIVAGLIAGGLDPAWIANAYVERIDPDRRLPDLINCACAAYVKNVACKKLGIVEPKTSAHKSVLSMRAQELRDALDALQRHTDELQSW